MSGRRGWPTILALASLAVAANAWAAERYRLVNSNVDGRRMCLTASGDRVVVEACGSDRNEQEFVYEAERLQPRSARDRCVDVSGGGGVFGPFSAHADVILHECRMSLTDNQRWYEEKGKLRSKQAAVSGYCLNWQYDDGGKVNARGCDDRWGSQQWHWERVLDAPIQAVPQPAPSPYSPPQGCSVVFVHGLNSGGGMWAYQQEQGRFAGEGTSWHRLEKLKVERAGLYSFGCRSTTDNKTNDLQMSSNVWRRI